MYRGQNELQPQTPDVKSFLNTKIILNDNHIAPKCFGTQMFITGPISCNEDYKNCVMTIPDVILMTLIDTSLKIIEIEDVYCARIYCMAEQNKFDEKSRDEFKIRLDEVINPEPWMNMPTKKTYRLIQRIYQLNEHEDNKDLKDEIISLF